MLLVPKASLTHGCREDCSTDHNWHHVAIKCLVDSSRCPRVKIRSSGSTRRSKDAPTWSASSQMPLRSPAWWAASFWSSRRNGSWSAGASFPRPPWPKSQRQKSSCPASHRWCTRLGGGWSHHLNRTSSSLRSTQNISIAELLIQ